MKKAIPGFCLALFVFSWSSAPAADRPNILIVLTDDMGFSDLGCFGGEIETPNLDGLAAGGLRFTEFYNTARCWPTRATLMSGRYSNGLSASQVTIAEVLNGAGYQTGMVGKWHLGMDPKKDGPIQRGFDVFYGTMTGAGSFFDPYTLARDTEFIEAEGEDFYYTDVIGKEAVRQIEAFADSDRPFFQYVAFTAAHWPIHAPEESIQKYIKMYEEGWEKLRQDRYERMLKMGIIDEERWPLPPLENRVQAWDTIDHKPWRIRNMAIYAAMVDHMDQAVGQIVEALSRTKQLDNTLIVYFHDNGACPEHLGGNGWNTANNVLAKAKANGQTIAVGDVFDVPMGGPLTYGSVGHNWACAQNTPMRRYKSNVHNGGACTPSIAHWPAGLKTQPGSISSQRGHVIDMMATCLELAGAEYPGEFNGNRIDPHESMSLAPIFQGQTVDRDHAYLFNHSGTHAVVKGDYKIVREGRSPWALYNLAENRTETKNLAEQQPARVEALAAIWNARYGRPAWDVERQGAPKPRGPSKRIAAEEEKPEGNLKTRFGALYGKLGQNSTTKVKVVSGPTDVKMRNGRVAGKQWVATCGQYRFKLTIQDSAEVKLDELVHAIEDLPGPYVRACQAVSDEGEDGMAIYADLGGAGAHGGKGYINMVPRANNAVTIAHEAGHTLEQVAKESDPKILDKWEEAIKADKISISDYGDKVRHEDLGEFAQLYAVCLDAGPEHLAAVKKLSPARFALWEKILNWPDRD